MLQVSNVVETYLAEINRLGMSIRYQDAPALTAEERLTRSLNGNQIPERRMLEEVVEQLFWSSILEEEGRQCRPRLVYSPTAEWRGSLNVFEKPVPLHKETLRKLTFAAGSHGYLVWREIDGRPFICGIAAHISGSGPNECAMFAFGPGKLQFWWHSYCLVTIRSDEVLCVSQCALPNGMNALQALNNVFVGDELVLPPLIRTLNALIASGHGGSLWIVGKTGSYENVSIGYRIVPDKSLFERFPKFERRRPWLESIADLASVDGAVLIDMCVQAIGFGCFIEAGIPIEILQCHHDGSVERTDSSHVGGGRHRSAAMFCHTSAPAAAFVVSADGRVTLFYCLVKDAPPVCAEILPLGDFD